MLKFILFVDMKKRIRMKKPVSSPKTVAQTQQKQRLLLSEIAVRCIPSQQTSVLGRRFAANLGAMIRSGGVGERKSRGMERFILD
jgi:hypothetical protein